jgi:hypothetical protein
MATVLRAPCSVLRDGDRSCSGRGCPALMMAMQPAAASRSDGCRLPTAAGFCDGCRLLQANSAQGPSASSSQQLHAQQDSAAAPHTAQRW